MAILISSRVGLNKCTLLLLLLLSQWLGSWSSEMQYCHDCFVLSSIVIFIVIVIVIVAAVAEDLVQTSMRYECICKLEKSVQCKVKISLR